MLSYGLPRVISGPWKRRAVRPCQNNCEESSPSRQNSCTHKVWETCGGQLMRAVHRIWSDEDNLQTSSHVELLCAFRSIQGKRRAPRPLARPRNRRAASAHVGRRPAWLCWQAQCAATAGRGGVRDGSPKGGERRAPCAARQPGPAAGRETPSCSHRHNVQPFATCLSVTLLLLRSKLD